MIVDISCNLYITLISGGDFIEKGTFRHPCCPALRRCHMLLESHKDDTNVLGMEYEKKGKTNGNMYNTTVVKWPLYTHPDA